MKPGRARILIVEDDHQLRKVLELELQMLLGCEVLAAEGVHSALNILRSEHVDLVLSDYMMLDGNGAELIHRMQAELQAGVPTILMTGYLQEDLGLPSSNGAIAVIQKPFDSERLAELIRETLPAYYFGGSHREAAAG